MATISAAPSGLSSLWNKIKNPVDTIKTYVINKSLGEAAKAAGYRSGFSALSGQKVANAYNKVADWLVPKAEASMGDWTSEDSYNSGNDQSSDDTSSRSTSYSNSSRKSQIAKSYDKAYDLLKDTLDDNFGFSSKDEEKMRSKINSIANSLKGGLTTYNKAQQSALDKSYNDVMSYQKSSLKDIYNTVNTGMKQGNDYLGLKGAGNSSASQMYARGLMGDAAESRRSVLEDARSQYAEIETKRKQADEYTNVQMKAIERQASSRIKAVEEDYADKRRALEKLASNADDYEREDIENEDGENLKEAYNKIAKIQESAQSWASNLASWKEDMYSRLDDLKNELISLTEFTAEEITMPEIDSGLEDTSLDTDEEVQQTTKKKNSLKDFLDNPLSEYDWLNSY